MTRIYIHRINIVFILVLFFLGLILCNFLVLLLLYTSFKWLIFKHNACLSICQALSGQMIGTTGLASLSCRCSCLLLWLYPFFLCSLFVVNILSKSFVSFKFSRMADCAFCHIYYLLLFLYSCHCHSADV